MSTEKMLWLNEKTVSAITGLSVSSLQKQRHHRGLKGGFIPYSKVGRSVRYSLEDVYAYMNQTRIEH